MEEFGFLGFMVYTLVHTPLRCGHEESAGDLEGEVAFFLPFFTSCCMVNIAILLCLLHLIYKALPNNTVKQFRTYAF
jgi:hypothetical protein